MQCEPGQVVLYVAPGVGLSHPVPTLAASNYTEGVRQNPPSTTTTSHLRASSLGLRDAFTQALSHWQLLGKSENSTRCLDISQDLFQDTHHGIAALSEAFTSLLATTEEIVQLMTSDPTDESWLTAIDKVWDDLDIILTSDVFRDVGKMAMFSFGDQWFTMHALYIRLWSLYSYSYGADQIIMNGISLFRHTLGEDGTDRFLRGMGGVMVAWVSDTATYLPLLRYPLSFKTAPAAHLDSFIESCALRDRYRPGIRALLHCHKGVAGAWTPDYTVAPRLHPEMQLITCFSREGIDVLSKCIGISKPVCWACEQCIKSPRALLRGRKPATTWRVSEVSGKLKDDWIPPPIPEGTRTVEAIARRLAHSIAFRLDPLLFRTDGLWVPRYSDDQYYKCPELTPVAYAWRPNAALTNNSDITSVGRVMYNVK
ncbi:hypothetical protein CERSUDRAFT_74995 [Gelatoporia subvermispora B]|uniref:Uncharacterized protein n=1 Tax=Ceriporiopsis subvermispora (strain B) TaxID=914234 RepID=M2QTK6_CERS8|nr:hypothetical protein CERSUDRAFT_74995 [Gelatoporia subvermispora B]